MCENCQNTMSVITHTCTQESLACIQIKYMTQNFKRTYVALLVFCISCGGSVTILAVSAAVVTVLCVSVSVSLSVCVCVYVCVCVSAQGQTTGIAVSMLT